LLGDDELFDQLEALAERDANADARQVIYDRMQMLSNDPDVLRVIEQLQIDPTVQVVCLRFASPRYSTMHVALLQSVQEPLQEAPVQAIAMT